MADIVEVTPVTNENLLAMKAKLDDIVGLSKVYGYTKSRGALREELELMDARIEILRSSLLDLYKVAVIEAQLSEARRTLASLKNLIEGDL